MTADYRHLADAFHARDIVVPMALAFSVSEEMRAEVAYDALRSRKFDQAPVVRGTKVVGFVLTRRLADGAGGAVADWTVPLGPPNLVSADARVADLLDWIADPGFLFVLEGRDLIGFVTVHDFNKQPCRAYFYLLIATLELSLADHLRQMYSSDQREVFEVIGASANAAQRRYRHDVESDTDADPVSYLGFRQLLEGIAHSPGGLALVGAQSRAGWDHEAMKLIRLRNSVMHPTSSLLDEKTGLLRLREHRDHLIELSGRLNAGSAPQVR